MKLTRILTLALVALAFTVAACAGKKADAASDTVSNSASSDDSAPNAAVVYFSATGVTKAQAERLGNRLGISVHELVPAEPYSEDDLNWRDEKSRSSRENADESIHPALKEPIAGLDSVKTIFVGFPVWWDRYPNIVATFMENHRSQLEGKTIVPFATSGGSTIDGSVKHIGLRFPFVTVGNGLLMNDVSDAQIDEWAQPYL